MESNAMHRKVGRTSKRVRTRVFGALAVSTALALSAAALAQSVVNPVDLTGLWSQRNHEDIGDAAVPGDYTGMPINDEARARADAWSASNQSMPDHQCIMYTAFYTVLGPQNLRISADYGPISGRILDLKLSGAIDRTPRTIWLDGRAEPSPNDRHTAAGFSSGKWQGDTLVVHTSHLTASLIGRTGVPSSDEATIDEYITRRGDLLKITMFMYDPVYFEEPYVRSRIWVLDPTVRAPPEPCEPAVEIPRPDGFVPSYLPGTNPALMETTKKFGVPLEAVRGGAKTTYPEYQKRIRQLEDAQAPAK